ncbi:hypothetical protein Cadr_000004213 [Camelus dromedarius]|uniref:Uncharacterized protein n=1 Tax=Camelus dromedarius TaxID=9838 RepID=A0A5N4ECN3_CAMDR|nr:hypothetical protein Cadr_000004213 [Camelus dromedarius]
MRGKGWGVNQRNSLESFRSRYVTLTLTLGGLWGPTPFSLPLFAHLTHRGSPPTAGLLQGRGCSPADFGDKGRGPQRFRTGPGGPQPTRASARRPPRQEAQDAGSEPESSRAPPLAPRGLTCRSPESRRHPALPASSKPDPGEGRPVGGSGKPRLPPSCFRPGGELGVGVRVPRPGRDVGEAGGGRCSGFAPVPSGGGHGDGGASCTGPALAKAEGRVSVTPGRAAGLGEEGRLREGETRGEEVRLQVKAPPGSGLQVKPCRPLSEGRSVVFILRVGGAYLRVRN